MSKAKDVIEADRAEAAPATNDEVLAKIVKYTEAIKKLKTMLKPLPPLKQMSLVECNKGMGAARKAKFAAQDQVKKALAAVLGAGAKPKGKAK